MTSVRGSARPRRARRPRRAAWAAAGALVLAGFGAAGPGAAHAESADGADQAASPALKLMVQKGDLKAYGTGSPKNQVYISVPMLVEATGGDLDVRLRRVVNDAIVPGDPGSYSAPGSTSASPIAVSHVVGGQEVSLPSAKAVSDWSGLSKFWNVTVTNSKGKVLADEDQSFCPQGESSQRIDPDSADENQYVNGCQGSLFTRSTRMGISDGWAVPVQSDDEDGALMVTAGMGRVLTVTLSVKPAYQALMGDNPTSATAQVRVVKESYEDDHDSRARARHDQRSSASRYGPMVRPSTVPTTADAPADSLPDMRALPSNGIGISRISNHEYLNFGATIWIGGASRMDIEGFRDDPKNPDTMTAYQYFYKGDQVVGKQVVGKLEFDRRKGHNHWHLEQFANYQLVTSPTDDDPTVSGKQSFCLAPTDVVDLASADADLSVEPQDLNSECGADDATWIREVLPVGWGDTYTQQKGGQAFDITKLKAGTYWIRLVANPTGALQEQDHDNNTSLRKVVISYNAKTKRHSVCVPAVDKLGQEGTCPKN